MKGIVFIVLNKLVEDRYGLATWDQLLNEVSPSSGGVYTSVDSYDDKELMDLVHGLGRITGIAAGDLVAAFGKYTLGELANQYPMFFAGHGAKSFLLSVDNVVHVEVRKLFPDAGLPKFTYEDPAPNRLVMIYDSPRRMCRFAEGLIDGTAQFFNTTICQRQSQCTHRGDDHCRFELQFGS